MDLNLKVILLISINQKKMTLFNQSILVLKNQKFHKIKI